MQLPHGAVVAVVDGEKLNLFRNGGDEGALRLEAMPDLAVGVDNKGTGSRHQNSSANHDGGQQDEDNFGVGVTDVLNKQVLDGHIKNLLVIAAPRTLGELRKHYHKTLSAILMGEIDKDLTGHALGDIEKAVAAK